MIPQWMKDGFLAGVAAAAVIYGSVVVVQSVQEMYWNIKSGQMHRLGYVDPFSQNVNSVTLLVLTKPAQRYKVSPQSNTLTNRRSKKDEFSRSESGLRKQDL